MGKSMHVYGIIPGTDEKFQSMLRIYNECEKAGITAPLPVLEFFDYEKPDPTGFVQDIKRTEAVKEYVPESGYTAEGFEVDLTNLPKDIKIIRFVNSY